MVSVPVLDGSSMLSRCLAALGISRQLDLAKSLALAHDMQVAARTCGG